MWAHNKTQGKYLCVISSLGIFIYYESKLQSQEMYHAFFDLHPWGFSLGIFREAGQNGKDTLGLEPLGPFLHILCRKIVREKEKHCTYEVSSASSKGTDSASVYGLKAQKAESLPCKFLVS